MHKPDDNHYTVRCARVDLSRELRAAMDKVRGEDAEGRTVGWERFPGEGSGCIAGCGQDKYTSIIHIIVFTFRLYASALRNWPYASVVRIGITRRLYASPLRICFTHRFYASPLRTCFTQRVYAAPLRFAFTHRRYASAWRIGFAHRLSVSA